MPKGSGLVRYVQLRVSKEIGRQCGLMGNNIKVAAVAGEEVLAEQSAGESVELSNNGRELII